MQNPIRALTQSYLRTKARRYAGGEFKEVLFYREDIERKLERKYRPGQ